jgi:hypothetical protein
MTINSTHMQRLLALGLTPEQMAEVLSVLTEVASQNDSDKCNFNTASSLEVSKKDICPKRNARYAYPPKLEVFWKGYPTDKNMSKAECLPIWNRMSEEDQQMAIDSLASFRAYCSKHPDYRPIHAHGYLKKRRFDGHAPDPDKPAYTNGTLIRVEYGTPQGDAWAAHFKQLGKVPPRDKNNGWHFVSEYP